MKRIPMRRVAREKDSFISMVCEKGRDGIPAFKTPKDASRT